MGVLEILILGLATWRLTSLLSYEDGPYAIFAKLRCLLGVAYDQWSNPQGGNELAKGILCPWCCSVWIGAVLGWAACLVYEERWFVWLIIPFALSAIAIVIDEAINLGRYTSGEEGRG